MRAGDVMTTDVITVAPETSVQDLAVLLANHGISGVPVVDAVNNLVGLVSEGDLLHRTETGTERRTQRRRSRWLDVFASDRNSARDYVRSHGRTVRDVMTRDVITVTETTELNEVANLLETKRVKRVPVVRDGKVIGIVSRANLVRALATTKFRRRLTQMPMTGRSAPSFWQNCKRRSGPKFRLPTSSCGIRSCIFGVPTTNPKR